MGIDAALEQYARVDAACAEIGRDPREVSELKENGLCGTPAEVVDRIGTWREQTGIQRVYLQMLDLSDLDHIIEVAADVAPQLS